MTSTIETVSIEQLRFPIGMFEFGKQYSEEEIRSFIKTISEFPLRLNKLASGLTDQQLDTPYRQNGWTIRQVIHHLADSHVNAYTRFRLALTEETPSIKPYDEKAWSELEDARTADIACSLDLLSGLHTRWALLLRSMRPEDFERLFYHPEHQMSHSLKEMLAMYAWHCDHHFAHIEQVKGLKKTTKTKGVKAAVAKKILKKQMPK